MGTKERGQGDQFRAEERDGLRELAGDGAAVRDEAAEEGEAGRGVEPGGVGGDVGDAVGTGEPEGMVVVLIETVVGCLAGDGEVEPVGRGGVDAIAEVDAVGCATPEPAAGVGADETGFGGGGSLRRRRSVGWRRW